MTPEQQALASRHIGLVGVHLRTRVPTPDGPMRHREYDDLFQEGCVALARAAVRYDPRRDGEFAAYALPRIRGAIHTALHERFSIIPVPARVTARARASGRPSPFPAQAPPDALSENLAIEVPIDPMPRGRGETIRHAVRRRFERAVRQAMAELRNRRWRRRNPCSIMACIAAERLLISQECERTPLRQIARQTGVSSSRASAYERQLTDTVSQHLARDVQVALLVQFASEDPAGYESRVDQRRRELLQQAELDTFDARFQTLERSARAELIYAMIEHSAAAVPEVARNLHHLTDSDDCKPLSHLA